MTQRKSRKRAKPQEFMPDAESVAAELAKAESMDDFFGKEGIFAKLFANTLEQMLDAELSEHLGYEAYEAKGRNSGNSRNGYYRKKVRTSEGDTGVRIPRDRNGDYEPKILRKYASNTNELEEKIIGLYAKGLSTRDIQDTLHDLYGVEISAQSISTITDKIWSLVEAWQSRPLDAIYPFVFLDALHIKLRREGKIENTAVYVVLGVDLDGRRDVLGHWIGDGSEGANFWLTVVTDLQARRRRGYLRCQRRWFGWIQGGDSVHLSPDSGPALHHPPDPAQPTLCSLERPQGFCSRPQNDLPGPHAGTGYGQPASIGRKMEWQVCYCSEILGEELGGFDDLFQLLGGNTAHHLHDQHGRSLSPAATASHKNQVLFPFTGGCA